MKKLFLSLVIFFSIYQTLLSQVTFNFISELNAKSIDGLGVFQINNMTGKDLDGSVMIAVSENGTGKNVVNISTQRALFPKGLSNFPRGSFINANLNFTNTELARIVNQTKYFPVGNYNICFSFISADKLALEDYENCFDAEVRPIVPMSLTTPDDKEKICAKRPMLSWQPPIPFNSSMRFRILLTEKKGKESVEELLVNAPLLLLDNISSRNLLYPTSSPELKEGKTYCWQAITYQNSLIISKSEIWEFTVQCNETLTEKSNDSYRELKQLINGNYYIANRFIKFSFINKYNSKKLQYAILDIDNNMKPIKPNPTIKLINGHNKIDLDLGDMELKNGKIYLLRVYPFNEVEIEIRFMYKNESD